MALKIPSSSIAKSLKASRADIRRQIEQLPIVRLQRMGGAVFGPLDEMRRAANRLNLAHQRLERTQELFRAMTKPFYRPQTAEVAKMLHQYKSNITIPLQRYQEQMSNLRRTIESMRTPWLDMENKLQSLKGFAALQGIGHALRTMPPFDTGLADALRDDLGDWRNETALPSEIFTDLQARKSFYEKCGLNPALTAFPGDAFKQVTVIVNINFGASSVPVAAAYNFGLEVETDTNESNLYRTNEARDLIHRFETLIRKYIDEEMKTAFGVAWVENQVPREIRQRWLNRRQKSQRNNGHEYPLIAYAGFTDYEKIITRDDNWQNAFESAFGRKDSVRESFRRLEPIRNDVMHSRFITQDDELYLYVEIKRILAAIGIRV